jgi:hypothetical protein
VCDQFEVGKEDRADDSLSEHPETNDASVDCADGFKRKASERLFNRGSGGLRRGGGVNGFKISLAHSREQIRIRLAMKGERETETERERWWASEKRRGGGRHL